MSRNYNNTSSMRRRSRGGSWQWAVIGLILGFACAGMLFVGAIAAGVVSIGGLAVGFGATQTPVVITATPAPVTPTPQPTEVIVTATPEATEEESVIVAPTATPTTDPAQLIPTATATTAPSSTPASQVAVVPTTQGAATQQSGVPDNTALQGAATATTDPGSSGVANAPTILEGIGSELVDIAGGTFQMGTTAAEAAVAVRACSEGYGEEPGSCTAGMAEDSYPQHPVTISPFRMEVTEVSFSQFMAFMNSPSMGPGSHRSGCNGQACMATQSDSATSYVAFDNNSYSVPSVVADLPMVEVTWFGAKSYCEAIGRRLPTEAEWERAARGDSGIIYPWGNDWDATRAWTNRSAPDAAAEGGAQPVTSFALGASPYGVLNMAGNVAEWVSDWYDPRAYFSVSPTTVDPVGPPLGDEKVTRGGSWDVSPFFARTPHRQSLRPGQGAPSVGFRCVQDMNAVNTTSPGAQTGNTPPIGSAPLASPTPDPATLGTGAGNEGDAGGAAPTLPPAPTTQPIATVPGTLAP